MTDYEFVKAVAENDGICQKVAFMQCSKCPIYADNCGYDAVLHRAESWLKSHKKENEMDGIKITVEEKKAGEKAKYPCFKVTDDGLVVLFYSPCVGGVIVGKTGWKTGEHSLTWAEEQFNPFHGTIKIEVE